MSDLAAARADYREARWSVEPDRDFTSAWWNETIVLGAQKFDRLTLPDKVDRLEEIGLHRPPFTDVIFSLNAARNCLTHRAGIVGPMDLKSPHDEGLEVMWTRIAMTSSDGREVRIGSQVDGGTITVEVTPTSRTFAIGERVTLTEDEFAEIAQTFLFYAQQVGGAILDLQRRRFAAQEGQA